MPKIDKEDSNYYCSKCDGIRLQVLGWVRLNDDNEVTTEDLRTDSEDEEDWWCLDCEEHTKAVHANERNEEKEIQSDHNNMYVPTHG